MPWERNCRSNRSQIFFKIDFLKNFAGKYLCWSIFLLKLQAWRPATLLRRDSNTGVFFRNTFFTEYLRWILLKLNPEARGKHLAIQILWVTAWQLVTRVSFMYEFSFCSWCGWTRWALWVNLKFYLSLSGFNQVEWGREMSLRFSFATPEFWELPLGPTASDVA